MNHTLSIYYLMILFYAHDGSARISTLFRIAEQEILAVDDVGLDRSLGKIVGHFYIGIVKEQEQLLFLILGIGDRLAKAGAFARSKSIYDLINFIEQRLHLFLPHLKYLLSAVFSLLCFLFVVSRLADQGNYLCRGAGGISLGYAVEEVSPAMSLIRDLE